jgi:CheY-like chemotaxis protein
MVTTYGMPDVEDVSVLVVDDDIDTRDIMADLLRKAGYSVVTASNGSEALALLARLRPKLILLDVQMPVMNGAEFREAHRRDQSLIRIPTIVITGAASEPVLDIGIDVALTKPVRAGEVMRLVRRHCGEPVGVPISR